MKKIKKSTNFVFSSRNPIARVVPQLYAFVLLEAEDFEKDFVAELHLEMAEAFESNIRYQLRKASMFDDSN